MAAGSTLETREAGEGADTSKGGVDDSVSCRAVGEAASCSKGVSGKHMWTMLLREQLTAAAAGGGAVGLG
jgi:hypothetical protein